MISTVFYGLYDAFFLKNTLKNTVLGDKWCMRLAWVGIQFSLLYDVTSVLTCYKYFEYHKIFNSTNIVNM